jgi:hypothetical protein
MNYLSLFTNDEITEGKKCLLNRLKRPPEVERLESPTTNKTNHHRAAAFSLNVQALDNNVDHKNEETKQ